VDDQRNAIADLLDGLTEEEARASLVPSLTTVLGVVKHASFVENVWFAHRIGGSSRESLGLPETVDESFLLTADDTIDSVRARFLATCERSRQIEAQRSLDEIFDWRGTPVSLRWIQGHMVRELARHAGHGDILVEQLRARRAT
jgi:hypothetical protein